jgi:hypothetical protein
MITKALGKTGKGILAVVLTVIFYGMITPVGLLIRFVGMDLLAIRKRSEAASYWTPVRPNQATDQSIHQDVV